MFLRETFSASVKSHVTELPRNRAERHAGRANEDISSVTRAKKREGPGSGYGIGRYNGQVGVHCRPRPRIILAKLALCRFLKGERKGRPTHRDLWSRTRVPSFHPRRIARRTARAEPRCVKRISQEIQT